MTDDHELAGLDPFDLLDREAARIDAYLSTLPEDDWSAPSRCEGWSIRAVLAHLASGEEYHRACLEGQVQQLMAGLAARGATDLDTANALGIDERGDRSNEEILAEWRAADAENRRRFRERGDGVVDTTVGDYPCRWQAFHVASELATHADDMSIPVNGEDRDDRRAWRARFSRFALTEMKPDLEVAGSAGGTRVVGQGIDAELDDDTFIEAVAARLGDDAAVDPAVRGVLSTMP